MKSKKLRSEVAELLSGDDGHGFDHVARVGNMALRFAQVEGANTQVVELAALLHDVDDYKLFGEESAKNLTNATALLDKHEAEDATIRQVLEIIRTMGYNKYLDGIRPTTLEGMVVSDADMCDAIGAEGILRTHAYALSKGHSFFDTSLPPTDTVTDAATYRSGGVHRVQHFFDKLLIIPSIMMTAAGKEEAKKREKIMVDFLEELFRENNATEWQEKLHRHNG